MEVDRLLGRTLARVEDTSAHGTGGQGSISINYPLQLQSSEQGQRGKALRGDKTYPATKTSLPMTLNGLESLTESA